MNKNKLAFLFLGFLSIAFIALFTITRVYTSTVSIRADLFNINDALLNNKKMQLWIAPFSDTDTIQLITTQNGMVSTSDKNNSIKFINKSVNSYMYEKEDGKKIAFTINPTEANEFLASVKYEANLWNRFISKSTFVKEAQASIINLRDYFNSTKKRYGYDIRKTTVTDTTVIFKSIEVETVNKLNATNQLFDELIRYSASVNAQYNGIRLLHYIKLDETKTKIFASICVTNSKLEYNLKPPFEFKRMPYNKNLLELALIGNLDEIEKATRVLDRYKSDDHYSSMAIPFVKIKDSAARITETGKLDVLIHYPVY